MKIMSRKKVVLFLVEGITEKESLELILQRMVNQNTSVLFEVVNGDITSHRGTNKSNIKSRISEVVKGGGKRKFKAKDYQEIIHIVDMDGAYISDECIFEKEKGKKFTYTEEGIFAGDKDKVIQRNNMKRESIDVLINLDRVFGNVPYRVFYFSCNLEHVLHNRISLSDKYKMKYAEKFQDRFIDDIEGFIEFVCNSKFSIDRTYEDSWKFIKEENNSIQRYTNLNIFVKEYS